MKKIALILGAFLAFSATAWAEIYHGVDIDTIYNSSDWSGKDKIKEIIDDYIFLQQHKSSLQECLETADKTECMDNVAEDVIRHFYNHNVNENLNNYYTFKKSVFAAYGIIYCLNKYQTPSGTMCNQENIAKSQNIVEQYINDLLQNAEQILNKYNFVSDVKD